MQKDPTYRIWMRLVSWFRRYVRRPDRKLKTNFLVLGIFPGKANNVILLGFECTINPEIQSKSLEPFLRKSNFLIFFLKWTILNFRGRGKTKKTARDIYKRILDIEFERDRSIGLGSMIGDGQTYRHTDIFSKKTFFECGSDVESKIIKKNRRRIFWRLQYFLHS